MKNENKEIFISGPAGRIQAIYFKNKKQGAPVAIVLQPHPQYGGTMNNRIVYEAYNCFYKNGFSVIRINFRGVEKSDGIFDNGQGELSDAAAALDWIEKENPGFSQCWVSGSPGCTIDSTGAALDRVGRFSNAVNLLKLKQKSKIRIKIFRRVA